MSIKTDFSKIKVKFPNYSEDFVRVTEICHENGINNFLLVREFYEALKHIENKFKVDLPEAAIYPLAMDTFNYSQTSSYGKIPLYLRVEFRFRQLCYSIIKERKNY